MKRRILSILCALSLALGLTPMAWASDYTDVKDGAWYADAVQTVTDKGLMNGTNATSFAPNAYVTRATVITVLWRMEGSPEPASQTVSQMWLRAAGVTRPHAGPERPRLPTGTATVASAPMTW